MFSKSAFEKRISSLASQAGLRIAELNSDMAKLTFDVGAHTQPLWIYPFGNVWEFSCPSIVRFSDSQEFPKAVLLVVLERNSKNKRGFWCIEELGTNKVLEYMHNIPEEILTPDEFSKICWGIVKEVEELEQAWRALLAQIL